MGKGSSSSETSQATTSTTNEVAAQSSGIAIGQGASYVNDLSDNAVSVINKIVDFSGGVLNQAQQIITDAQAASLQQSLQAVNLGKNVSENAISTASTALSASQLGQTSILTNPATLIAIVAAIGLVAFLAFKKGKLT